MFTLADLKAAQTEIYQHMPATPQYSWPMLNKRAGTEIWVKHENHTPTGAFKVRGGLLHLSRLKSQGFKGSLISATRGNHGQSLALASQKTGIPVTIVVPEGNSQEKNAAIKTLGANLIIHGKDFDEAVAHATHLSQELNLQAVPAFHKDLVTGVATYAYEFFKNAPNLEKVYVGIGMGSGICGLIKVRDLLGLNTKIIGVVSKNAPAYALSFNSGKITTTQTANTFADGVACRMPNEFAFDIIKNGVETIIQVSDENIKSAMRCYYKDTHNIAEGAGAIGLAGLLQDADKNKRLGTILSGGNIDMDMYSKIITL